MRAPPAVLGEVAAAGYEPVLGRHLDRRFFQRPAAFCIGVLFVY